MTREGLGLLIPQWDAPSTIQSLVSTRHGGVSQAPYASMNLADHVGDMPANVIANRALLRKHLPEEPIWLNQVHGTLVSTPNARLSQADAIVSNIPNEVLAIMTADCLPVLFANVTGTVIGAAHAGWRGLSAGVLENTVKAMRELETSSVDQDIHAWMGPAIGPLAFEVGQDVVDAFADAGVIYPQEAFSPITHQPGKYLANIYLLARSRLEAEGIQHIDGGEFCTVTQAEQFFSYRRDGVTGRFASLIWIDDAK